ncbi:MAG: transposase, partial [Actinobacteria bacterium]|nr:transposase [Actinomycetota bacterium]
MRTTTSVRGGLWRARCLATGTPGSGGGSGRPTSGDTGRAPRTDLTNAAGRPHVASWAQTATTLAADLLAGNEDPRRHAAQLLRRALAALPESARAGRVRLRADAGYFAGELARAALGADVEFAIGAKRIAPLWRILSGVAEADWTDATGMPGAQVAVTDYRPDWWPATTRLLIRRVALAPEQVSADPRSRRRRTLHPEQRALPIAELAAADAVYGYSFIVTDLDVSSPAQAAAVEHWYRHRTSIENIFRDAEHGAALRHLPSVILSQALDQAFELRECLVDGVVDGVGRRCLSTSSITVGWL